MISYFIWKMNANKMIQNLSIPLCWAATFGIQKAIAVRAKQRYRKYISKNTRIECQWNNDAMVA